MQEALRHQQRRRYQRHELQGRKKEILASAVRQGEQLVTSTERRLKRLSGSMGRAASTGEARGELRAIRDDLQPFRPRRKRQGPVPQQLLPGELVCITALGVEARVEQVADDSVELLVNGKRLRQPLQALEQYQPRRFAEGRGRGTVQRPMVIPQDERPLQGKLVLIGHRVEDALPRLERFLDDALLGNLNQVEIVHGSGAGILRRVVREFLAAQVAVSAFYAAASDQGGENVTIAELGGR